MQAFGITVTANRNYRFDIKGIEGEYYNLSNDSATLVLQIELPDMNPPDRNMFIRLAEREMESGKLY